MMDTGGSNAPAGLARFDGTRKRRHGAVVVVGLSLSVVWIIAVAVCACSRVYTLCVAHVLTHAVQHEQPARALALCHSSYALERWRRRRQQH